MALITPVYVNAVKIAELILVRIDPVNPGPENGDDCLYKASYEHRDGIITFNVSHPYIPFDPSGLLTTAFAKVQELMQ